MNDPFQDSSKDEDKNNHVKKKKKRKKRNRMIPERTLSSLAERRWYAPPHTCPIDLPISFLFYLPVWRGEGYPRRKIACNESWRLYDRVSDHVSAVLNHPISVVAGARNTRMTPDGPYVSTGLSICLQRREIFMHNTVRCAVYRGTGDKYFFFSHFHPFKSLLLVK